MTNAYRYCQDPPGIASAEVEFDAVEVEIPTSASKRRGLVYIDWHETKALLDRPYLIDDVIDAGAMVVAYGDSNAGKTYVVLDQCFHIAAGKGLERPQGKARARGVRRGRGRHRLFQARGGVQAPLRCQTIAVRHHPLPDRPAERQRRHAPAN